MRHQPLRSQHRYHHNGYLGRICTAQQLRWFAAVGLVSLFMLGNLERRAVADVRLDGNVWLDNGDGILYAENPFTSANDGIPLGGNIIEGFRGMQQVRFEGRAVDNINDPSTPTPGDTTDDGNVNFNIIVGRTSSGQLSILGGSDLRDMDLIIGDSGIVNSQTLRGSGTVRIDGEGSLYNNNPFLLPYFPGQDPENPMSPSFNPRELEPGAMTGFDLYVGRGGNGTLQISAGGRGEIQDAVVVGDQSGSTGAIIVDGIDSFLGSGGFATTDMDPELVRHEMIIGRIGVGSMTIQNGGTVYALGPLSTMIQDPVGAVIGSHSPFTGRQAPQFAGQGTVTVDGLGSDWLVGGTIQIGGFHDSENLSDSMDDLEGDDVEYVSTAGRGTLNISNGGVVSIVSPLADPTADQPNRLDVVLGRFGTLNLTNGSLAIQPPTMETGGGENVLEINNFRIINDGVVQGSGSISVGQFRNRVLGEIRVGAGEKLLVHSSGVFNAVPNVPVPGEEEYPLSNYGLIEVLGTETALAEIEFLRSPGTPPTTGTPQLIRPFLNLPIVGGGGLNGRTGGEIIGRDAIMRFTSDIINSHKVSFIGGDNLVSGNFFNDGTVFVGGDNTTVSFVDQFFNNGVLQLEPNISLVMFIDDVSFMGSGSLSTTFGGRPTGQSVSQLSSAENIVLGGALNASLFTAPGVPSFSPQPGDQFQIISSAAELLGDFADVNLPGCIATTCFVGFPDYALDTYFIRAFSIAAAMGADFDGNGFVDEIDLAILRQNLGGPGPVGDANGDGIVDGLDFFIWFTTIGPVPGAGGGSGGGTALTGSVPEPASVVLLAAGGLLALAVRPRRR